MWDEFHTEKSQLVSSQEFKDGPNCETEDTLHQNLPKYWTGGRQCSSEKNARTVLNWENKGTIPVARTVGQLFRTNMLPYSSIKNERTVLLWKPGSLIGKVGHNNHSTQFLNISIDGCILLSIYFVDLVEILFFTLPLFFAVKVHVLFRNCGTKKTKILNA